MDIITNHIKENITSLFNRDAYDIAIIGSSSDKDCDIFVLNKAGKPDESYNNILDFIPIFTRLIQPLEAQVITKHEHRKMVITDKPIIHLLYYPSIQQLTIWELPSFIACVYDRGQFISGNRHVLKLFYDRYRSRTATKSYEITRYQLMKYCDLVVSSILYLAFNSNLFGKEIYVENLLYTLRFILTELLISEYPSDNPVEFWDWKELLAYLQIQHPEYEAMRNFLQAMRVHGGNLSLTQISEMFLQCLRLCDYGLEAIRLMNFPNVLQEEREVN